MVRVHRRRFVTLLLAVAVFATGLAAFADDAVQSARTHYKGRQIARTMHWSGAEWLLRETREKEENASALMRALEVKRGQTVCDLGCGNGFHSLRLARLVGPEGKVLAVDIQAPMLEGLKARQRDAGLDNIETILGEIGDPKLPPESCDLILLVDVYHEFGDPETMLKQMRRALKPNGRIALVEFRAEDLKVPIKPLHKMSKQQILKEFPPSGYRLLGEFDELPWQHLMFFGRDQRRVLFLGNSYTAANNLPGLITELGGSDPNRCDITTWAVVPGGSTLERHVGDARVRELLAKEKWDRVVLQEQSTRPLDAPDEMREAAQRLKPSIEAAGARPVLYLTWARQNRPQMIEGLEAAYRRVARELKGDLAPVGLAFEQVRVARPELELYAPDGSHPSAAGSYLAACVLYGTIAERDPRGLGGAGLDLPDDLCTFLQNTAWSVLEVERKRTNAGGTANGQPRKEDR